MFYRQSRETFVRSIGEYGYIYSKLTKHDRTYTQEGKYLQRIGTTITPMWTIRKKFRNKKSRPNERLNTRRHCNASMTNNMENKPTTTKLSPWGVLVI